MPDKMIQRAYSLLTIKAADDETGEITGIASTPTPDRMGDIVEPKGAEYKMPLPLLWQHSSGEPLGHVTKAKVTKEGIEVVAKVALGVTEEIDRAWKLIKNGLVRGLSIGFRVKEFSIMEDGGWRIGAWEWLELSAVTIPANSEATIQTVKSIDTQLRAATGKADEGGDEEAEAAKAKATPSPGVSGKTRKTVKLMTPKEIDTMAKKTIAEQISAFEATRAAKSARMEEIMDESAESGETLTEEQTEEYDNLSGEVKQVDDHLKRLRDMERQKAASAKAVDGADDGDGASKARDPGYRAPVQVKRTENLKPGIRLARVVKCLGLAQGNRAGAYDLAKTMYQHDEAVVNVLKAAVAAGTVGGDGTWAGNLVGDETNIFADFAEFLRPMTILGKFGQNGIPSLRSVPFRQRLLGQTSGGAGYWVGEAKPKPLTKFDFSGTTLEPLKVANIAVLSMENIRDSSPSSETLVRDGLAGALRERMDIDFIDPDKTADSGVSPASVTNAVTPAVSSGNDADSIREDVRQLFNTFIAANNAPTSGVWIMPATVALALSLMTNELGQSEFPSVNMNGGTFQGLPVITSEYVPTVTEGTFVILANASDIYMADEGGITIDMSREASLQMDSEPDDPADASTVLVSLWQHNLVGFLAERTISWKKRRATAVAVLGSVHWGEPSGS